MKQYVYYIEMFVKSRFYRQYVKVRKTLQNNGFPITFKE